MSTDYAAMLTWLREQIDTDDKLADQMDLITTVHERLAVGINAGPWHGFRLCRDVQQLRHEVESRRALLDIADRLAADAEDIARGDLEGDPAEPLTLAATARAIRAAVAAAYADRPDYHRQEWRS